MLAAVSHEPSVRTTWALCGLALAAAAALRLAPCFGDLWLDEIWSLESLRRVGSASEIFTTLHHSNNHHLMSLWLLALGDDPSPALARLPSWLAGIASVALMGVIAARRSRLDAVFATTLGATCFALLHFASEARGYALAVACALLAHRALVADLDDGRRWGAPVFAIASVLGFLAHQTFLFYWAGAMAWSGWRILQDSAPRRYRATAWLRLHGIPLIAWGMLYAIDLRLMTLGGGDPNDGTWLAARVLAFGVGAPVARTLVLPGALLLAAALGVALLRMARRADDAWIAYALTIVVAPLLLMAPLRPEVLALRYFLIGIAFGVLLLASLLADAFRSGTAGRFASLALLAAFVLGNGLHSARFLEHGRGGYRAALDFMAARSGDRVISVGTDHDFRTGLVLRYYGRSLPPPQHVVLERRDLPSTEAPDGAEWRIIQRAESPREIPRVIQNPKGRRYEFAAAFPHGGISGFHWSVYRRVAASGASERRSSTIPNP